MGVKDDGLTTAVYERAGFPPTPKDILNRDLDYLAEARKDAIRERTGRKPARSWAITKDPEGVLTQSGFDRTMRESLQTAATPMELVLFMSHVYSINEDDQAVLKSPSLAGCYNRALLAMKEDIRAIDGAVTAITGQGQSRA